MRDWGGGGGGERTLLNNTAPFSSLAGQTNFSPPPGEKYVWSSVLVQVRRNAGALFFTPFSATQSNRIERGPGKQASLSLSPMARDAFSTKVHALPLI